jgi:hypothetical protein
LARLEVVMTRKRCIRGWSVLVIVTLVMQTLGGAQSAAAAQEPSGPLRAGGLQTLVPESDTSVDRFTGAEAWRLLEEKVISKDRHAWEAAIKTKEARGWTKTDRVVAFRARQGSRFTRTQAQAFDIGGALLIEWEWYCDPYHVCGTYYFESYADGGNITYDAEFVPTGPASGYTPWANYIRGSAGLDSRRQRAALATASPSIRLASSEIEQRATPDDYCPGLIWEWQRCMRDCLGAKHAASMGAAAGAAGGVALTCVRALRPGSLVVMGASYVGCIASAFGTALLSSFVANHWYSPCDASGGNCGPKPC